MMLYWESHYLLPANMSTGMRISALLHLQVRYHTWTHKTHIRCVISRRLFLDFPTRRHLHPGIQTRHIAMSRHLALPRLTRVEL
jgi:hypothetical protein